MGSRGSHIVGTCLQNVNFRAKSWVWVRVSLQEMNVIICDVQRSDENMAVCLCA